MVSRTAVPVYASRVTVHYRRSAEGVAPCGYRFERRLLGLDFSSYFTQQQGPMPVDCRACINHVAMDPAAQRRGPARAVRGVDRPKKTLWKTTGSGR